MKKNYLKSKDKDYVNKIVVSQYEQDTGDIIPSYKTCTIYGLVHFKQNGKDKNGHQNITVLTVIILFVIELIPYSTDVILLRTNGLNSLNWVT